jgi:hypothetical protein
MKKRAAVTSLALLSVLLAGALAGCNGGSGGSGGSGDSGGSGGSVSAGAPAPVDGVRANAESNAESSADSYAGTGRGRVEPGPDLVARAVIRKGDVELRAADVGKAQFEVQRVVDRHSGQVTEEKTTTDDDGDPAYTRMVLRIPTGRFSAAMSALKEIGELESADSSEDDVTTQLIDTRSRLRAQKRSIARITVLFDRAESIRDIMAIEAELSRRQADLDSLERQLAYLRGQTSMSTITVSIDEIPTKAAPKKADDDHAGFVAGLSAGWDALSAFAVALATALGALLPWLIVLGILGPPAYLLARALRRRVSRGKPGRTPSAA